MTRPTAIAADPAALGSPRLMSDGLLHRPDAVPARADRTAHTRWFAPERIGVISNARSHRNKRDGISHPSEDIARLVETPRRRVDLAASLARLAAADIDLLVIDGGDGTVRDVITAAPAYFTSLPPIAVVPSGKTNALAIDLGLPVDWTVSDAIAAARAGRFARRAPIEVTREGDDDMPLRGFLFGAGAFVQATMLAQRTHRAGAFKSLAVGLSLTLALGQTFFGKATNAWRIGQRMGIRTADGRAVDRNFYILLAATLENLPLGLKPLGRVRPGLKLLAVDAPPRGMLRHVPALLAGSQSESLKRAGYHHGDPGSFHLSLDAEFILDGEHYPGGELSIATGAPIDFAVP